LHRKKKKNAIDKESKGYFISAVSREVDLSQKTIREYEKMGLVKPRREHRTNNRIYSNFDIAQIRQVSHLIHNEGFTLPCLRRLLQSSPCWNVFDCDAKEECSAYNAPYVPCYETRKTIQKEMQYQFRLTDQERALSVSYVFVPPDLIMVHTEDITERKRAEEAWWESEKRFSTFMEYLPANVTIKDHESKFLFANKHMRDLFDTGTWIGKTAHEYFPPEIAEKVLSTDRQALEQGPIVFEEAVPIKTGEVRIFETRKFPIKQEGKPDIIGVISIDITERKQAEDALRESEARAKGLLNAIPDTMFRLNREGIFLDYKAKYSELYTQTEPIIGKKAQDILPQEFVKIAEHSIRTVLETGEMQIF